MTALFRRVNVNRPGPPEKVLDEVLRTLAQIRQGSEKVWRNQAGHIRRKYEPVVMTAELLPDDSIEATDDDGSVIIPPPGKKGPEPS